MSILTVEAFADRLASEYEGTNYESLKAPVRAMIRDRDAAIRKEETEACIETLRLLGLFVRDPAVARMLTLSQEALAIRGRN